MEVTLLVVAVCAVAVIFGAAVAATDLFGRWRSRRELRRRGVYPVGRDGRR